MKQQLRKIIAGLAVAATASIALLGAATHDLGGGSGEWPQVKRVVTRG